MTSDRNENDPWKPCPMDDSPTLFPIRQPFGQPGFLDACGVSAQRLHDWASAELLSFDFSEAGQLEESHLAEVHVVRSILEGGLRPATANAMLASLPKPFRYDPNRLCYNFHLRRWQMLPSRTVEQIEEEARSEHEPSETVETYIEELATEGDVAALEELWATLEAALKRAREEGSNRATTV